VEISNLDARQLKVEEPGYVAVEKKFVLRKRKPSIASPNSAAKPCSV
jgi:hypothetical protein